MFSKVAQTCNSRISLSLEQFFLCRYLPIEELLYLPIFCHLDGYVNKYSIKARNIIVHHLLHQVATESTDSGKEYNATIDFYWSPLLLESNGDSPTIHWLEYKIIWADRIEKHASAWRDADIIIFNSYVWWRKHKADMRMKVM